MYKILEGEAHLRTKKSEWSEKKEESRILLTVQQMYIWHQSKPINPYPKINNLISSSLFFPNPNPNHFPPHTHSDTQILPTIFYTRFPILIAFHNHYSYSLTTSINGFHLLFPSPPRPHRRRKILVFPTPGRPAQVSPAARLPCPEAATRSGGGRRCCLSSIGSHCPHRRRCSWLQGFSG